MNPSFLSLEPMQELSAPLFAGTMGVRRTTMVWQTSIRDAECRLCAVVTQTQWVMDAAAPRAAEPG
ncbi:hypothetical protein VARIO8X_110330 [Burkholderiales bacterium 8X]|nr:hypothetical protein VARIO8X_110330 [Burkholderiales bacterium 8X]